MRKKRALISAVLLSLTLSLIPISAYQISKPDFFIKVEELNSFYLDGQYWNHYNSSDYSHSGTTMCPTAACQNRGYCAPDCPCECGQFYYNNNWQGGQCHGFAMKMAYLAIGSNPQTSDDWITENNITTLYYGDVVRYRINGIEHTIFITDVSDNDVWFADCNFTGPCRIRWGGRTTIGELNNNLICHWSHP